MRTINKQKLILFVGDSSFLFLFIRPGIVDLQLISRLTGSESQGQEGAACVRRLRDYRCVIYSYQRCEICKRCNSVILSAIA